MDTFPGPEYAFGTLRCASDNLNGDNVEFIYFPAGVTHVFCYGIYVKPPPTSGTITIRKQVTGNPPESNAAFRFTGTLSFNPTGFALRNGESSSFYRAGGSASAPVTWNVTEGDVDEYVLDSVNCQAVVSPGGGPGLSKVDVTGRAAAIHLVAGEQVTCVFTNRYVPPPGGLTIRKITVGDVGTFAYTVRPTSGGGLTKHASATTTEEGIPVNAEPSLQSLAPGAYEIDERLPSSPHGSWRLTSVHCTDSSEARTDPVKVTIRSGAQVTCVYTNTFTRRGSIAITKVTQGGVGRTGFEITPLQGTPATYLQSATTTHPGVAAAAHPHTSQDATDHLELGAYRIVEEPPASGPAGHWTLTGVRCNRVDVPFAEGGLHRHPHPPRTGGPLRVHERAAAPPAPGAAARAACATATESAAAAEARPRSAKRPLQRSVSRQTPRGAVDRRRCRHQLPHHRHQPRAGRRRPRHPPRSVDRARDHRLRSDDRWPVPRPGRRHLRARHAPGTPQHDGDRPRPRGESSRHPV